MKSKEMPKRIKARQNLLPHDPAGRESRWWWTDENDVVERGFYETTEYVRADIVNEMRNALQLMTQLFNEDYACSCTASATKRQHAIGHAKVAIEKGKKT